MISWQLLLRLDHSYTHTEAEMLQKKFEKIFEDNRKLVRSDNINCEPIVCLYSTLCRDFCMHYYIVWAIWVSQQPLRQILLLSFPCSNGGNEDSESVSDSLSVTHLHSNTGTGKQLYLAMKAHVLIHCANFLQKHFWFFASIVPMPRTVFISCFPSSHPDLSLRPSSKSILPGRLHQ